MASFEYRDGELRPGHADFAPGADREAAFKALALDPEARLAWGIDEDANQVLAYEPRNNEGAWLIELRSPDASWYVHVPEGLPGVLRFVKEYGLVWVTANQSAAELADVAAYLAAQWSKNIQLHTDARHVGTSHG